MERRQRHISQKGGRPRSVSKAVTSLAAILTVFPYIYIYIYIYISIYIICLMHTISERQREEKKNCPTFYEAAITLITKPANVNSKDSFYFWTYI